MFEQGRTRRSGLLLSGLLVLWGLLVLPLEGLSQAPTPAPGTAATRPRRVAVAKYTDQKITVDGHLDEAAWETAEVTGGFTQQDPRIGEPASESTDIRILYDRENLYLGIICHDRTPEGIVIRDISRDLDHLIQDYVTIHLDTFHDRSNGYVFTTTAAGGQHDAQFSDEGRVNNINWDGVWYIEAQRDDGGFTLEYAIPFKTLRFSNATQQVWGINFLRRIRRHNESTYWSPSPRRYNAARSIPYAGDLIGIENVEPSRNFQIKPYGLAGVNRIASLGRGADGRFEGGLDMKYGVTPGLSLDLTANTDFSEVDADTQQINLTRFSTFFPEKREFFLENAGLFQLGTLTRDEGLLFQSRTIGLENANPIPILGGVRLSGRAGRNHLGFLNMQTRSKDAVPATNFTVARLKRDIFSGSNVGVMFLNRQSGLPDGYNRAFAADTNFVFPQPDLRVSAALARTISPGRSGNDRIGKVEVDLQNDMLRFFGSYVDVGRDFNPEMGFVQRTGRQFIHNEVSARPRFSPSSPMGKLQILDVTATMRADQVLFSGGGTEEKSLNPSVNVTFLGSGSLVWNYFHDFERIVNAFSVSGVNDAGRSVSLRVPVGDYRSDRTSFTFSSDRSKPLSANAGYNWGGYYRGTRKELSLGLRHHIGYRLFTSFTYARNNVHLPQGQLHVDQVGLAVEYTINPKMFLSSFIQYNNQSNQLSSNIRFRLIHHPLSDLFLVYNELRDRTRQKTDAVLALKYTRLISF